MMKDRYEMGELVALTEGAWKDQAGVVSWPITQDRPGYVLVCADGKIAGLQVSVAGVRPADPATQGFSQLTYQLLKLSSYIVEKSVLPLTR